MTVSPPFFHIETGTYSIDMIPVSIFMQKKGITYPTQNLSVSFQDLC